MTPRNPNPQPASKRRYRADLVRMPETRQRRDLIVRMQAAARKHGISPTAFVEAAIENYLDLLKVMR